MVTTRVQAGTNYFSPHNFNLTQVPASDQPVAPKNAPPLDPHRLYAQEIHQAGIALDHIIHDVEFTRNLMEKSYFPDQDSAFHDAKDSLYSTTLNFLACARVLSKAFSTFDSASIVLSEKSRNCVMTANAVAISLRTIQPIFSSHIFSNGTSAVSAFEKKVSANLYAAGISRRITLFLNAAVFMSISSKLHIGYIGDESEIFLKKSNSSEFAKNLAANNELSAITTELNTTLTKSSIALLTSFDKALPDPLNFHHLYVDISCKALATVAPIINASLAFVNLYNVLIDNKDSMHKGFQGSYAAITNQAANASGSLVEATIKITEAAFTEHYPLKGIDKLNQANKQITFYFNSAIDFISRFLAANQYLTESICKHPYNANIEIAFETTKSSASTLFEDLISLQESIKQAVSDVFPVIFPQLSSPIASGQISETHATSHAAIASASAYASPYIDVESLASTAARITGAAAHAFTRLALHLEALKTENPQELQNYEKFSNLAQSANLAVYKTIRPYQTMESAAQIAVKTEGFSLENFQQKTLAAYQAANAAVTQFRSIHYTLHEYLKTNIFNDESREKINYARTAGIAASEAFNALAAHKFFSHPANGIENTTRDFPQKLQSDEINDVYAYTDKRAINNFNHSPLTLSNIKLASRAATLNSLAASTFDTIETTYKSLNESAKKIKDKNGIHQVLANHCQNISFSIIHVKAICFNLIRICDGGTLNSTDISNIYIESMERMREFFIKFTQEYHFIKNNFHNITDQTIVVNFHSTQPACAAFIESFYGFYFYAQEIKKISNFSTGNDFSAYEVESMKNQIESMDKKFEDLVLIIPISQDESLSDNNDLIDPAKMV